MDRLACDEPQRNPGGGFPKNAVLGSTRVGNQLWFAWSAGTDGNFSKPHVEMVTLDRGNNFNKTQQVQIWNPDYAFAYPALSRNACTNEIGLSWSSGAAATTRTTSSGSGETSSCTSPPGRTPGQPDSETT